jgi:hypothetical protein
MSHRRFIAAVAVTAAASLALSACASATPAGSAPDSRLGAVAPGLPATDVVGQGTVLDEGSGARLCLGPVMESYPPQCSGIPLEEWTWDGVEGSETSGDVTWGAYAVQGRYDGSSLTVTQPPMLLALYDPMAAPDPTGGQKGTGSDAELARIQQTVHERLGDAALSSWTDEGWLWVDVIWDDGTLQDAADGEFGAGKVVLRSALREVG